MNSAAKEIFADLFAEERKNAAQDADLRAREEIAETMLRDNEPADKIARQTRLSINTIVNIAKNLSPTDATS